tara:strand:- start:5445 stop:5600 length:156 start_codon:yes stop_codon:yes gene_type:complete
MNIKLKLGYPSKNIVTTLSNNNNKLDIYRNVLDIYQALVDLAIKKLKKPEV